MKPRSMLLLLASATVGFMLTGQMQGQTFTTLYSFTLGTNGTYPNASLCLSGNKLYGTASDTLYGQF